MIVAAQLYTVRDRLRDPGQLAAVLGGLRKIGYAAIEIAGVEPAIADRLEDDLKASGPSRLRHHVPLHRLTDNLAAEASRCRRWAVSPW